MAKTYRAAQQWDHWLAQFLGSSVLQAEQKILPRLLADFYGKNALLVGVPRQSTLLHTSVTALQLLLTPIANKQHPIRWIEGDFHELPIASGSIDLVLLPHTLEYADNPRQLLAEACRIVKPEGHIVILGFNPVSLWGLRKSFAKNKHNPWSNNFFLASTIKQWLELADFKLVKHDTFLFRPPLQNHNHYRKLKFLEWLGQKCYKPWGGAYVLIAQAKVIPLIPIKMRWQQKLSGAHVIIPGSSMRDFS